MSIRRRLALAFALVAATPVLLLGLGLRYALERRAAGAYAAALSAEAGVVAAALEAESDRIGNQLSMLRTSADDDNRLRRALLAPTGDDDRYLLGYARTGMTLTGLSLLRLIDQSGTVLSSGHFLGETGQVLPPVADTVVAYAGQATLVRAREPSTGTVTALVRIDSLTMAGRRYYLLGGISVDSAFLARLPGRRVALRAGGPLPGSRDTVMLRTAAEVWLVSEDSGARVSRARVVVTGDREPLRAAQAELNGMVLGGLAAAILLGITTAWWLAGRLSRPIVALADQTSRVDLATLDVDFASDRTDEVGQLAGLLGAMVERLKSSRNRLAAAERRATIGDLSRQVNHDIRNGLTPLRNVLVHLEEVARESPSDVGRVFLERRHTLESSLGYLDDLARNIASLTPDISRRPCDVNATIRDIAGAEGREAALHLELDARDPVVLADPVAVRRVFHNLIDNALDSAGMKGRVVVSGTVHEAVYRITVRDDGPGMDQEQLERAFNEWYTTKTTGTGLGLPIVRRLVLDLGGSLRVETEPGRGTSMTVELPLDRDRGRLGT